MSSITPYPLRRLSKDGTGDKSVGCLCEVDPVPGDVLGRVRARRRLWRTTERYEVEVVFAATAATARRQWCLPETCNVVDRV